MSWWTTFRADYSKQIAQRNIDASIFGVKTANNQEIYIGWAPRINEWFEGRNLFKLAFEYIPRAKSAASTAGAKVAIEIIPSPYNASVEWSSRPTEVTYTYITDYDAITPDKGVGFTLTDAATIKALMQNKAHVRIRAIGDATNDATVVVGRVNDATTWARPYYTVSYDIIPLALGTKETDDAPELAIFNWDKITLRPGAYSFVKYGAVKGGANVDLLELITYVSYDKGASWNWAWSTDPLVTDYNSFSFAYYDNRTDATTATVKFVLLDKNRRACHWQREYAVQPSTERPSVKITRPDEKYINVSQRNPLTIAWYMQSPINATQARWAIYIGDPPRNDGINGYTQLIAKQSTATAYSFVPKFEGKRKIKLEVADSNGERNEDEVEIVVIKTPTLQITVPAEARPICTVKVQSDADNGIWELKLNDKTIAQMLPIASDGSGQYRIEFMPSGRQSLYARTISKSGIYSTWARATVNVINTVGPEINLNVVVDAHKAILKWTTDGAYRIYWIYRDGKEIGRTASTQYTDEYAAPTTHTYTVYGIMMTADGSGGDYTLSNAVTAALKISGAVIAATDTGGALEWLSLRLGTDVERAVSRSVVQDVTYTHYAGRDLPVAELSEYRDESYSGTVVLTSPDDRARFEALLGHEVCYKRRGISVTGMMAELSSRHTRARYDAEYSFTIRAIDSEVR